MKELQHVGLVFLTWRAPKTLRKTLERISQSLPIHSFGDAVIYAQEITQHDRDLANEFGLRIVGNNQNVGILAGMKEAVASSKLDVVLYLECDCLLVEPESLFLKTIVDGYNAIETGKLDVLRLRHLRETGADYNTLKHLKYWGDKREHKRVKSRMMRLLRPRKASRLIGDACLLHSRAEEVFPKNIYRMEENIYCMRSSNINWTNQSIMISKEWFLNTIIPYAESHPSSRLVNGYLDLEKEMNCEWWRKQKFRVGWADPGLFTHARMDRPVGDEKLKT
ncbi:hypothetical protein N8920_08335 [Opitutales bacterium]|nr:hypothetical protein [Opitutales bacterium]